MYDLDIGVYQDGMREYKNKSIKIIEGINCINECYIDDKEPSELIKNKAKIFLSSLITVRNFKLPEIFPTLRGTIQFEWEIFQKKDGKIQYGFSDYLEFEIYENKISMLYANTTGEFGGLKPGEMFHYSCNFKSDERAEDFYWLFRMLDKLENGKDKAVCRFLELFTMDYSKELEGDEE